MKKRILTILLVLTASAGVMVGCSQRPMQDANASETSIQQSEVIQEDNIQEQVTQEGNVEIEGEILESSKEEVSEVKGIVDEIKDFMFIVTDDEKVSYAFTFEEKPEGLGDVSVGDKVIVKYTGTISMVDPFLGEILSVERQ